MVIETAKAEITAETSLHALMRHQNHYVGFVTVRKRSWRLSALWRRMCTDGNQKKPAPESRPKRLKQKGVPPESSFCSVSNHRDTAGGRLVPVKMGSQCVH